MCHVAKPPNHSHSWDGGYGPDQHSTPRVDPTQIFRSDTSTRVTSILCIPTNSPRVGRLSYLGKYPPPPSSCPETHVPNPSSRQAFQLNGTPFLGPMSLPPTLYTDQGFNTLCPTPTQPYAGTLNLRRVPHNFDLQLNSHLVSKFQLKISKFQYDRTAWCPLYASCFWLARASKLTGFLFLQIYFSEMN